MWLKGLDSISFTIFAILVVYMARIGPNFLTFELKILVELKTVFHFQIFHVWCSTRLTLRVGVVGCTHKLNFFWN